MESQTHTVTPSDLRVGKDKAVAEDVAFEETFDVFLGEETWKRNKYACGWQVKPKDKLFRLQILSRTVVLHQENRLMQQSGVTGAAVWDAAVALALHLESLFLTDRQLFSNKRIIELGSGTYLYSLHRATTCLHIATANR